LNVTAYELYGLRKEIEVIEAQTGERARKKDLKQVSDALDALRGTE